MLRDLMCENPDCLRPTVRKDVWVKRLESGQVVMEVATGTDIVGPICDSCGSKLRILMARFAVSRKISEVARTGDPGSSETCGASCGSCNGCVVRNAVPFGEKRVFTDPETGEAKSGVVAGVAVGRNRETGEPKTFEVVKEDGGPALNKDDLN